MVRRPNHIASGTPLRVGIVGCGTISRAYVETLEPYGQIELVAATDLEPQRAEVLASVFGGTAYPTLEAMLGDDRIDAVLNLTFAAAHAPVTAQCLAAGKHVYSEKPLSLAYSEATELVALAQREGVRLSCAPTTFLGEAQQTAWKVVRDGLLGQVRVVYADMNWGRFESMHPAPQPYFEVGPLYDIGVYSLALLTTFLGPVRSVLGYGRVVADRRVSQGGVRFRVPTPDFVVALLELANGVVARLSTNWYVGHATKQKGVEFHGDLGSLYLRSVQNFDADVEFAELGGEFAAVRPIRAPYPGTEWGRGVVDLADAIAEGRPHRATGEHAAHIVETLNAIESSLAHGGRVEVLSDFARPAPTLEGL